MNAQEIQSRIEEYVSVNSGLEERRDYLGISKIAGCPRAAVLEYRNGTTVNEFTHRMCYAGYEQENKIMAILGLCGIATYTSESEVVAPFDVRLRGHVDAETPDHKLVEIKSVSVQKFEKVREKGKALFNHFVQVQLYMRYGRWKECFVVYRCRETYEHLVIHVPYIESQARKFEEKAKSILRHIDAGTLPVCECGRCKW